MVTALSAFGFAFRRPKRHLYLEQRVRHFALLANIQQIRVRHRNKGGVVAYPLLGQICVENKFADNLSPLALEVVIAHEIGHFWAERHVVSRSQGKNLSEGYIASPSLNSFFCKLFQRSKATHSLDAEDLRHEILADVFACAHAGGLSAWEQTVHEFLRIQDVPETTALRWRRLALHELQRRNELTHVLANPQQLASHYYADFPRRGPR